MELRCPPSPARSSTIQERSAATISPLRPWFPIRLSSKTRRDAIRKAPSTSLAMAMPNTCARSRSLPAPMQSIPTPANRGPAAWRQAQKIAPMPPLSAPTDPAAHSGFHPEPLGSPPERKRITMIHHRKASRVSGAVFAALTLILSQGIALAQPPGGPPPGGPGGPGGPPPGGPGGPGGPRGRGMSAVNVPAAALAADLKLTTTQQEKIDKIQKQFQQDRSKLMPARPEQGADPTDQGGAPPDPETMR